MQIYIYNEKYRKTRNEIIKYTSITSIVFAFFLCRSSMFSRCMARKK